MTIKAFTIHGQMFPRVSSFMFLLWTIPLWGCFSHSSPQIADLLGSNSDDDNSDDDNSDDDESVDSDLSFRSDDGSDSNDNISCE